MGMREEFPLKSIDALKALLPELSEAQAPYLLSGDFFNDKGHS